MSFTCIFYARAIPVISCQLFRNESHTAGNLVAFARELVEILAGILVKFLTPNADIPRA